MHSTLTRIQSVFGLFTSIAFFVAITTAISVLLYPQTPTAELSMRSNQVVNGRPSPRSLQKIEYAHIRFDLTADLSSLFTYNTKQVFVYVLASWPASPSSSSPPSSQPAPHQAVIWDAIIPQPPTRFSLSALKTTLFPPAKKSTSRFKKPSPSKPGKDLPPGVLKLTNQRPKYPIADISGHLSGTDNATLTLGYNIQPWVGALVWNREGRVGRWEGLKEDGGERWRFSHRKVKANGGAEGTKRRAEGGKVEGGGAAPVVEV